MTPTADILSGIKPDGSREQPPKTVGKILVAKQVPKIVKVACRFAKARRHKAIVYILGAGDPATNRPDTPMTRRTAEQLMHSLGDRRFDDDDLDLIIQSSGGDIHAAYLIMSMLRERMKDEEGKEGKGRLIACVPSRAMSAATLLCLGADEILLGELGAVGPLDAQIRKGVTDAGTPNYISALHLLKALSRLQEFSLDSFTAMADILDVHRAPHDDQIKYGIEYSHAITCPLFEHIESGEVGYWDQMLKTGEEYGRRLLEQGHLVGEDGKIDRENLIKSIVHQLVFDYPSHELVIDSGVLNQLKLRAGPIPKDNGARRISGEFAERSSESLIMLVDPDGAPGPIENQEISLKDWQKIGTDESACDTDEPDCDTDEPARDIVWADEGSTFAMRVALYRPTVRRRRWDKPVAADGGPATQYIGGPVEV
jgi:serine dehydrogenase proteinase